VNIEETQKAKNKTWK